MHYVSKRLKDFSTSHRLGKGYPGLCKNGHGHGYHLEVTLKSERLNLYGFVMDFGEIKKLFDKWVQENWDHATLCAADDISLIRFLESEFQRHYILPKEYCNTTAENMSEFLFHQFQIMLRTSGNSVELVEVKVWETDDSVATYRES